MHVLCGLDDSAPGRTAACVAGALAQHLGARLSLVHVAADPEAARPVRGAIADDVAAGTRARVALHVNGGEPGAGLLSATAELGADLLVIGHTRRGRLAGVVLGEVQDRVLQDATVPVMLVPPGASLEAPGRIVLACRRSAEPRHAAELAGRLAGRMGTSVVVTQVVPADAPGRRPTGWEVYDAARRDARAALAVAEQIDVRYAEYEGEAGPALAAAPDDLDAALVVVGERPRPAWQRALRPSVAAEAARRARHPVVVVRP